MSPFSNWLKILGSAGVVTAANRTLPPEPPASQQGPQHLNLITGAIYSTCTTHPMVLVSCFFAELELFEPIYPVLPLNVLSSSINFILITTL